jgi:hypothetical protein
MLGFGMRRSSVVLFGVSLILVAPIVEELFWRGFVLWQLGKGFVHWGAALFVHAILWALAHPAIGNTIPVVFVYGIILGAARIKFGSLVPLILAHAAINALATTPYLVSWYEAAETTYPARVRIDTLAQLPPDEALPELITFFGHPSDQVSSYATYIVANKFGDEAEPYLADALRSKKERVVDRALFVIGYYRYDDLLPQVREIVWSGDTTFIQLSAISTLDWLGDKEGLQQVARDHPSEKIRNAAKKLMELGDSE